MLNQGCGSERKLDPDPVLKRILDPDTAHKKNPDPNATLWNITIKFSVKISYLHSFKSPKYFKYYYCFLT